MTDLFPRMGVWRAPLTAVLSLALLGSAVARVEAQDVPDPHGAPTASGAQDAHAEHDAYAAQDDHDPHDMMPDGGDGPQFSLHGFSDVTLRLERTRPAGAPDSSASGFALGQFDLFMVSRLAQNLSFLGETVFEAEPDGQTGVDVERIYIRYAWADFLHLAIGRTHTALGYWNEVFHHGTLLQPSVERPEALKFEDLGGILPVHSVGVEGGGRLHSGDWDLDYVGNVGNGRGVTSDVVQSGTDSNRDKAAGIKLSLGHSGPQRFALGPSFHRDLIPPDPSKPGRQGSISERIVGFHANLSSHPIEALAEFYRVRHEDQGTSIVHTHEAWYGIVILDHGRWKPYAGIDRLAFSEGDPFYVLNQHDLTREFLGLRIETNPSNALKLEYRHDRQPGEQSDALLVQTAFSF